MKILVVDDSSTMRRIITNTLKQIGEETVVEAEDGREGMHQLKENPDVGLVLTDWNMPTMNGFEFLQKVRETNKDIPIVMITTEAEKANVVKAIQAGANNYVVKPFTADTLKQKIGPLLKGA